jgi:hypothetical protein
MDTKHQEKVWFCQLCHLEFSCDADYKEHISDSLTHNLNGPLSDDEITMLTRLNAMPKRISMCCFCDFTIDEKTDIRLHVAEHLRKFALTSLPWDVLVAADSDGVSRSAFDGARTKGENSSIARMEDFIDEETLSFDESVHESEELLPESTCDLTSIRFWPKPSDDENKRRIVEWASTIDHEIDHAQKLVSPLLDVQPGTYD